MTEDEEVAIALAMSAESAQPSASTAATSAAAPAAPTGGIAAESSRSSRQAEQQAMQQSSGSAEDMQLSQKVCSCQSCAPASVCNLTLTRLKTAVSRVQQHCRS